MTEPKTHTEAHAVAKLVKELHKPDLVDVGGQKVLIRPEGMKAESIKHFLDEYRTAPERRKGTANVNDLASFIAHTKRFADEDSALFADPGDMRTPKLLSVLDYHERTADGEPRFGEHRTLWNAPTSDEWKAWTGSHDKRMAQADFANFIEDRITDLANPDDAGDTARALILALDCRLAKPVEVLECSRQMEVNVGMRVVNAIRLPTGEAQIHYETEVRDKKGEIIQSPPAFLLRIPIFKGGDLYEIAARLRFRTDPPNIVWWYSLYRPDRSFEHAFNEACKQAAKETGLPLFVGTPER